MALTELPPLPAKEPQVWPLSLAAYHALGEMGLIPERTELLYGFVYRKMSKSPLHSALTQRLLELIRASLLPGFFVRQEQPLTCADSEPEPDLAVIRGREEEFWEAHPQTAELVIEVAVSSHDYDRFKLPAYAAAGVRECWLVLVPERRVEVLRQPGDGQFTERTVLQAGEMLTCPVAPGFRLEVGRLFEPSR